MVNLPTRKKGVTTVQEKAVELTVKQRLGQFKSNKEKDILSGALAPLNIIVF
jgi:hypothetical protein